MTAATTKVIGYQQSKL